MDNDHKPGKKGGRPARMAGGARLTRAAWIPVLHIEDDSNDRELFLAATVEAGVPFEVHSVSDGSQAIAFLSHAEPFADRQRYPVPALILLDLKMPGSTGLDILNWLGTQRALNRLPVIVLSGSESEEDIRQAYASGANAYMIKPLGFNALVEMIRTINLGWFVAPHKNGSLGIHRQVPSH